MSFPNQNKFQTKQKNCHMTISFKFCDAVTVVPISKLCFVCSAVRNRCENEKFDERMCGT